MSDIYREFIETIRAKSDILQLVSDYVSLTRRGGKYWGCCPFHQEKTASFTVSPDKGFFYCFGCRTGGDAISFVQKIENLTFSEALALIAGKYGIAVPEEHKSSFQKEQDEKAKAIYQLNDLAKDYFVACLHKTAFGQKILSYLHDRGINDKTIEAFSLGASLQGDNKLYTALLKRDIMPELMLEARLVSKRSEENYFDFFRSRVMIPIKDARGRVVGFGGRVLGQGNPKYLNTAESMWFNKRRLLYGMDIALPVIRQSGTAIIVEGYMDAIALHSAGFANTVASLGTAFSQEQAKLLSRAAKEVVFCYDSDQAGLKASFSAISIARRENLTVKAIAVPDGKDPDEFIRNYGRGRFASLVENAKNGFIFQNDYLLAQKDFSTLAGKLEAVANILPIIAELKSDIEIRNSISVLASKLVIDEATISSELNKYLSKNDKLGVKKIVLANTPFQYKDANKLQRAEGLLLKAAFEDKEAFSYIEAQISRIGLSNHLFEEIFALLKKQKQEGLTREELFALLSDEGKARFAQILADESPNLDVEGCIRQVKKSELERRYNEYRALAAESNRLGDSQASLQYLVKCNEINEEIKKLH